jgi:hypothetical protein
MRCSGARGSVLALLTIVAVVTTTAGTAAATPTRTVKISPVTASHTLKPGYTVGETHYGGKCEAGSDVMSGVYRCFAQHGVYDPCWAETDTRVGCLPNPWSHRVVRINVNTALEVSPGGPLYVWGVRLSTGQRCVAAQGAHDSFGKHVVNFGCGPGYKLVLLDNPDKRRSPWTIREAVYDHKGNHYNYAGVARITTAWYGLPSQLPGVTPNASSAQRCSEWTNSQGAYVVWIDYGAPTYVNCTSAADVFANFYEAFPTGPISNQGISADGANWFCGTADSSVAPLLAVCFFPNSLNTTAQISAYPPGAIDPN